MNDARYPQHPSAGDRPDTERLSADSEDTTRLEPQGTEHTSRFVMPPAPPQQPARRGRGFAAAVLTGALVLGGGAGLGGAALYDYLDDDESTGNGGTPTRSQVVDAPTQVAADGTVQKVAEIVLPSVVKIDVATAEGAGSGSGIILSSDGQILTNEHVVAGAESVSVSFDDGTRADATVLGTDPLTDTAVIQAEGVSGLTPATIGQSSALAVGQGVVAVGSPFGLESTVTSGIVSALNRPVDVGSDEDGNATVYPAIQTDAAINPGNSGGPLVDLAGNVVGINSSIRTSGNGLGASAGSIGLGFAIPIDEVMAIVEQMANGETPTHARLGISVSDPGLTAGPDGRLQPAEGGSDTEGAVVQEVGEGSTAGAAGLEVGDVITRVDDQPISGADSLVATIRSYRPGDTVEITYQRDGEELTTELVLDSDAE